MNLTNAARLEWFHDVDVGALREILTATAINTINLAVITFVSGKRLDANREVHEAGEQRLTNVRYFVLILTWEYK